MAQFRLPAHRPRNQFATSHLVTILFITILLQGLYALLRYKGYWGEVDTATFSTFTRAIIDAKRLTTAQPIYVNGYGYQSLALWLTHLANIDLAVLQIYLSPLLIAWLTIPAWLFYKEITSDNRAAFLAVILLFVQPEFVFAVLRGTHEKFSRGLMLLALYALIRAMRSSHQTTCFAVWLFLFNFITYALISFNSFIGATVSLSIVLSLFLIWIAVRLFKTEDAFIAPMVRRLMYAAVSSVILGFIFAFYTYPPAQHTLLLLGSIADRVVFFLLDLMAGNESTSFNPYNTVDTAWISLPVYSLMSIANWELLAVSSLIWVRQSLTWLRKDRRTFKAERHLMLWAFYGAFAAIGVLSIVVDVSGAIAGNLQHRVFPSFAMLACPLVAAALIDLQVRAARVAKLILTVSVSSCVVFLALLSLLKATNEPVVSNKWLFYHPSEMAALAWADSALSNRPLWTGYDERLSSARTILQDIRLRNTRFVRTLPVAPDVRDYLVSSIIRARALRLSQEVPIEPDSLITYDNGQSQIYHLRAHTPFQR